MASSLNKITLIGNLGRDPEIRMTTDSAKIATFSVATSETWRDKLDGERKERVEWHNVVVFNPHLAEIIENYYRKGHRVYVEGQMQSRKYTDGQGVERTKGEVVISRYKGEVMLMDSRGANASLSDEHSATPSPQSGMGSTGKSSTDDDDEIPF